MFLEAALLPVLAPLSDAKLVCRVVQFFLKRGLLSFSNVRIVRVQCAQALIMGSIEQPDSIEKGLDFYDDKQDVQIHEGEYLGRAGISMIGLAKRCDWH